VEVEVEKERAENKKKEKGKKERKKRICTEKRQRTAFPQQTSSLLEKEQLEKEHQQQ
jgi:hypothetical protein